jgi:hypothetical protein
MTAWATDPRAEPTMVTNAVAMNSALPRPHSARQPTISSTVSDIPARPAAAMMITSPISSVFFGPIRLDTTPVTSIATPVTAMKLVNSSNTCGGVALRFSAIGLRMGSTRPIPMNATTDAKATAQTDLG